MASSVFVSSSSDIPQERRRAITLIDEIGARFHFSVAHVNEHAYAFERDAAIGASARPIQDQIRDIGAHDIDLVVFIFSERIGLPLPPDSAISDEVRQLIDGGSWRSHFTYPGQEHPEPGATPLTGTLYELFSAIAFKKKVIFLCKGARAKIFDVTETDLWKRSFGGGDYCMSFNLGAERRAHTDEERAYLYAQLRGIQRLYDFVLSGRERHAFETPAEFEHILSKQLKAHWEADFDRTHAQIFLGLEPYGAAHASFFMGRQKDVKSAIAKLSELHNDKAARPRLLITGRSGVGKSSFVAAGLAPRLADADAPETKALGLRFKPVMLTPGVIADRVARGETPAYAVTQEIAAATDEHLEQKLAAAAASSWTPDLLLQTQGLLAELRSYQAEGQMPWRPLVIVDQLEDAFAKGARAFERDFGPALDYLDQLAAHRVAWVIYVLTDTSRGKRDDQEDHAPDGWLKLWLENPTVVRMNAQSAFAAPFALRPLSADALEEIVVSTFARAGVEVAPAVLDVLRFQISDAATTDHANGLAFESILPLVAASMQLSEQRRLRRLGELVTARKLKRDEPITRAAWLIATNQDVRASSLVTEDEARLSLEDLVHLTRSIEVLAERAFGHFVSNGLGIDWEGGEPIEGQVQPAPRHAEHTLHKLLRWLVSQPDPDSQTIDWSKLAAREEKRAAMNARLGPHGEALLDEFIRSRLLRTDRQLLVRLSHVALVRHWGRARAWCEAEHGHLRTYAVVQSMRSAPSPAQLKTFRSLYAAWGFDGPWRSHARPARPGPNTDREWLRHHLRLEALAVQDPNLASGALYAALRARDDDLAAELVQAYANSDALKPALDRVCHPHVDPRQPPPLVLATELSLHKATALLAAHAARPFALDRSGQSAFHKAAANGDANAVSELTKRLPSPKPKKANPAAWPPSQAAPYGWTPLHFAAKSGDLSTVRAIVAAMSLIGPRTAAQLHNTAARFGGATALHFAARQHRDVATAMLREIVSVTHAPHLPDPRGIMDSNGFLPLHLAAANDDYDAVSLLFRDRRGTDAKARAHSDASARHTALSIAARRGAEHSLHALLDADVLQVGGWAIGKEALRLAAGYGHERIVAQLLARGQSKSLRDLLDNDESGRNALHLVAQFRRVSILRMLLGHNNGAAIVNAPDKTRARTPLHWACFFNDPDAAEATGDTIKVLLENGADRRLRDESGATAFQLALRRRVKPAYDALVEGLAAEELGAGGLHDLLGTQDEAFILRAMQTCPQEWLTVLDEEQRTLLHRACFAGLRQVVRELLRRAPDLGKAVTNMMRTPLHEAACSRSPFASEMVDALVNGGGADVMAVDVDGRTALHCAAFNANSSICRSLLTLAGSHAGQLLAHTDRFGKTALHCAAEAGDAEAAAILLQAGANPSAKANADEGARTPAHLAAYYGGVGVLDALYRFAPDILDERTSYGDTLLHCAAGGSRLSVVDWLIDNHEPAVLRDLAATTTAGATPFGSALIGWAKLTSKEKSAEGAAPAPASARFKPTAAVARQVTERLKALLPRVFGNSLPDDPLMTAAAVRAGDMDLLVNLVEQGAPVVAQEGSKQSPLHIAVETRDEAMARIILAAGGARAATSVNHHGRTPLHLAALLGLSELIDPLVEAGASVLSEDGRGRTPADLALGAGHLAIIDQLRARGESPDDLFKSPPTGELARELFEAIKLDDTTAVRTLLERAPSERAKAMALKLSCAWGATSVLETLFSPCDPALLASNEEGDFAVLRAVRFGRAEVVQWIHSDIIRESATILFPRGETLLHIAARYGHTAICRRLIECGANQTARDSEGRTPLHRAALALRADTVALLGESAAARAATDAHGQTALHVAASVRVNDKDHPERGSAKRATLATLLRAGLDPSMLDAKGRSADDVARERNDVEAATLIATLTSSAAPVFARGAAQPTIHPPEPKRIPAGSILLAWLGVLLIASIVAVAAFALLGSWPR